MHNFNHTGFKFGFVDAETGSGVALGVEVDDERAEFVLGEIVAKIDRGSSFTDTSFLIRDANHNSHIRYYSIKIILWVAFGGVFGGRER